MTSPIPAYSLFLRWLLLTGLLLFAGWVLWDRQLLLQLLASDPTRITLMIALLFLAASGHCGLRSFYLSSEQEALQRMTGGMGVALNTTLLGLSCSMLLGLQYLMLDRAADRLVAAAVHLAETCQPTPSEAGI